MNRTPHIARLRIALALLVTAVLNACATAGGQQTGERWYVVELAGQRAGSVHETVESQDGQYRTTTDFLMSFNRGAASAEIKMSTTFVETHDGRPVSMRFVQDMGVQSVDTEWRFEADKVVSVSRQADREITRESPLPEGEWLTPAAIRRYWLKRREAGAERIVFRTIDPQAGLAPVTIVQQFKGDRTYEADGRTIPVTEWESTSDLVPIPARELYSADGYLVRQEINAGFGTMVTRIATQAEVAGGAAGPAPEILVSTFVEPDRPIPDVLDCTSAKFRLTVKEGRLPDLPSAGAQRVDAAADGTTAILTVDMNAPQEAGPGEKTDPAYLESTAMVNAGDPAIDALAQKAVAAAGADAFDRAEALRQFVHRYVNEKGLDTAFATASETAQTRTGDCSEHAVLLCALLRADGIPARVAIGLVYADSFLGHEGIFGWHMWTQALIDGRWVDFDATLPRRYHAGHVLTGTSALGEGGLAAELASSIALMGNLRIEVLDLGCD